MLFSNLQTLLCTHLPENNVMFRQIWCKVVVNPRVNIIHLVLSDTAPLDMMPAQDRDQPGGGQEPGQPYHDQSSLLGPPSQVAEW